MTNHQHDHVKSVHTSLPWFLIHLSASLLLSPPPLPPPPNSEVEAGPGLEVFLIHSASWVLPSQVYFTPGTNHLKKLVKSTTVWFPFDRGSRCWKDGLGHLLTSIHWVRKANLLLWKTRMGLLQTSGLDAYLLRSSKVRVDILAEGPKWRQKPISKMLLNSLWFFFSFSPTSQAFFPFTWGLHAGTGRKDSDRFFRYSHLPAVGRAASKHLCGLKQQHTYPETWGALVRGEYWASFWKGCWGHTLPSGRHL